MAIVKRWPNKTANWDLVMDHSRGGIIHCFSERFNTMTRSQNLAPSFCPSHRPRISLVPSARTPRAIWRRHDVPLRQSYRRVAKRAAIMVRRYTHAHQFKRARRALKFLRIRLGRVIRDIRRKIAGKEALEQRFADLLALAVRVRFQDHRQRGHKVYALHAPEVECIGKG